MGTAAPTPHAGYPPRAATLVASCWPSLPTAPRTAPTFAAGRASSPLSAAHPTRPQLPPSLSRALPLLLGPTMRSTSSRRPRHPVTVVPPVGQPPPPRGPPRPPPPLATSHLRRPMPTRLLACASIGHRSSSPASRSLRPVAPPASTGLSLQRAPPLSGSTIPSHQPPGVGGVDRIHRPALSTATATASRLARVASPPTPRRSSTVGLLSPPPPSRPAARFSAVSSSGS